MFSEQHAIALDDPAHDAAAGRLAAVAGADRRLLDLRVPEEVLPELRLRDLVVERLADPVHLEDAVVGLGRRGDDLRVRRGAGGVAWPPRPPRPAVCSGLLLLRIRRRLRVLPPPGTWRGRCGRPTRTRRRRTRSATASVQPRTDRIRDIAVAPVGKVRMTAHYTHVQRAAPRASLTGAPGVVRCPTNRCRAVPSLGVRADIQRFPAPQHGQERQVGITGSIGTIRAEKGFGFIKDGSGKEYFFHRSAVQGQSLDDLREGDSVEFNVGRVRRSPGRERPAAST